MRYPSTTCIKWSAQHGEIENGAKWFHHLNRTSTSSWFFYWSSINSSLSTSNKSWILSDFNGAPTCTLCSIAQTSISWSILWTAMLLPLQRGPENRVQFSSAFHGVAKCWRYKFSFLIPEQTWTEFESSNFIFVLRWFKVKPQRMPRCSGCLCFMYVCTEITPQFKYRSTPLHHQTSSFTHLDTLDTVLSDSDDGTALFVTSAWRCSTWHLSLAL